MNAAFVGETIPPVRAVMACRTPVELRRAGEKVFTSALIADMETRSGHGRCSSEAVVSDRKCICDTNYHGITCHVTCSRDLNCSQHGDCLVTTLAPLSMETDSKLSAHQQHHRIATSGNLREDPDQGQVLPGRLVVPPRRCSRDLGRAPASQLLGMVRVGILDADKIDMTSLWQAVETSKFASEELAERSCAAKGSRPVPDTVYQALLA
eukprot:753179-Hanusia_phi.AAC.3